MNASSKTKSSWKQQVPVCAGWVYSLGAIFCLITIVLRYLFEFGFNRITVYILLTLGVPALPTLSTAVLLAFVALLCFMRKRLAVIVMIAMQSLMALLCLLTLIVLWFDGELKQKYALEPAIFLVIAIGIIVLLTKSASGFWGRVKLRSLLVGFSIVLAGEAILFGIAFALTRHLTPATIASSDIALWVLRRISGLPFLSTPQINTLLREFPGIKALSLIVMILSAVIIFYAVMRILIGQRCEIRSKPDDLRLRKLLIQWGAEDSLGYFATRNNRTVIFSSDESSAISYGVSGGIALAAGDPIGNPDSWEDVVLRWKKHCYSQGWIPAVIAASAQGARVYRRSGMMVKKMGDEAIISADRFDENSVHGRALLAAQRRIRRSGINIEVRRQSEITPCELSELEMAASLFRIGNERGFSMSLDRVFAPQDDRQLICTARGNNGELQCLLTFVPWGPRGVSLNLMRRAKNAANGVVEAMVLQMLQHGFEQGIDRFSLNFAMFREIFVEGESVDATLNDRFKRILFIKASKFWQLQSLYESNARYNPRWLSRYMCFSSDPLVPLTLIAAGCLEGFIPAPASLLTLKGTQWEADEEYLTQLKHIRQELTSQAVTYKLTDQQKVRRKKAEKLLSVGIEPFPPGFDLGEPLRKVFKQVTNRTALTSLPGGNAQNADINPPGSAASVTEASTCGNSPLKTHGRIVAKRNHGGVWFWDLYDRGTYLQVVLEKQHLASRDFANLPLLDLGDQIVVSGTCGTSRNGTPSLIAQKWVLAAKALRPSPHPKENLDEKTSARDRTLTLRNDPVALQMLEERSRALTAVRAELAQAGFLEVETPMLQAVQGGANARPFVTRSNAYSIDMFLRIAPELYLKRLAVAGMGAIFEMGRSFRNEGADATHNPEFTSLEVYKAGADYLEMMTLTRKLYQRAARAIHGREIALRPLKGPGNQKIERSVKGTDYYAYDISGDWPAIPVYQAISKALEEEITADTDESILRQACQKFGIDTPPGADHGRLIGALYDELVEAKTTRPTFYMDFPVSSSPLTRKHRDHPRLAERWDLVAFGMELGTAYTELTDPRDQRERFTQQSLAAAAGDPEAMSLDEDFLNCLELGLLPLGGLGLGMDRMVMMLLGCDIRQVLAFPFVKPRS